MSTIKFFQGQMSDEEFDKACLATRQAIKDCESIDNLKTLALVLLEMYHGSRYETIRLIGDLEQSIKGIEKANNVSEDFKTACVEAQELCKDYKERAETAKKACRDAQEMVRDVLAENRILKERAETAENKLLTEGQIGTPGLTVVSKFDN